MKLNFKCDVRALPAQIVRVKLSRSEDGKSCDASMIDARGGAMSSTYYVEWKCSYIPVEMSKAIRVGSYVLQSPTREGVGPLDETVRLLSLTIDEVGSSGGGVYVIENNVVGSLVCTADDEFLRPEF